MTIVTTTLINHLWCWLIYFLHLQHNTYQLRSGAGKEQLRCGAGKNGLRSITFINYSIVEIVDKSEEKRAELVSLGIRKSETHVTGFMQMFTHSKCRFSLVRLYFILLLLMPYGTPLSFSLDSLSMSFLSLCPIINTKSIKSSTPHATIWFWLIIHKL